MIALTMHGTLLLAFWSPGPWEMLVLALVALLLYGGDLPEVARSWGKTLAEFRRGLSGMQNEINEVIYDQPDRLEYRDESYSYDEYQRAEAEAGEESSVDGKSEAQAASESEAPTPKEGPSE